MSCSSTPGYYLSSEQHEASISDGANDKQQKAGAWLQKIFKFLVDEGLHDPQEEVRCALLQAGLAGTQNYGVVRLSALIEAFIF